MDTTINKNKIVELHFTLTGDGGEVLDSSRDGDPLVYLHGHENIVPGLEKELEGRTIGDTLEVRVEAEDGYGQRVGPGPQTLPRDAFPEDAPIEEGMQFAAPDGEDGFIPIWIVGVSEEGVTIDFDHPLAGKTLHFDVEVMRIRAATGEELSHGHAHGFDGDGHHHH